MASVSVSHMILFIASLIVAASVAGTFTAGVERLDGALSDASLDVSNEVRTDLEIISDAGSPVYDRSGNGNITLLVKNTGTRNLPPDGTGLDVLVDGMYQTSVWVEPIESNAQWQTNDVVRVHIDAGTLGAGDHRVKLVMGGDEEVFVFNT
ncbi:flagellar protein FlaG [Halogranum gelatinilyticum]|uniref:Flagellar protein FlaG n=1 Tax=Halogranum gelatinilyticum TaxID=660521 RepID=A0A1G9R362_9EURY|nr:flagellar protein G [Halogranum gelatinilyticum]SDM17663.1 flagellar protein FlaG [Halogranum gelatinilyticum]